MNAAEEMVVGAARQAAERGDATAIEASLLIVIDNQQAAIKRVRQACAPNRALTASFINGTTREVVDRHAILRALGGDV